jgi:hypothetical protein
MRRTRNLALFVADHHQWLCEDTEDRSQRFLFNASCLIFFYYYVQRFFYTKKLNAVLINSVCSSIGRVPKVMVL